MPKYVICTYIADSERLVRDHARAGGFPADRISVVWVGFFGYLCLVN